MRLEILKIQSVAKLEVEFEINLRGEILDIQSAAKLDLNRVKPNIPPCFPLHSPFRTGSIKRNTFIYMSSTPTVFSIFDKL